MKKSDREKVAKAVTEALARRLEDDGDKPAAERLKTRDLLARLVTGTQPPPLVWLREDDT